jgi:hypothetical protein
VGVHEWAASLCDDETKIGGGRSVGVCGEVDMVVVVGVCSLWVQSGDTVGVASPGEDEACSVHCVVGPS